MNEKEIDDHFYIMIGEKQNLAKLVIWANCLELKGENWQTVDKKAISTQL